MPRIAVVFHALPAEIIALVKDWLDEHALYVVAIEFFPKFHAERFETSVHLLRYFESTSQLRRLCLCRQLPDMDVLSPLAFMQRNPNSLVVDIGRYSKEALVESGLFVKTETVEDLRFWRPLASRIKKKTAAGLWAVSSMDGAKRYYKDNRYTAGVAAEAAIGLQLLPAAGGVRYFINEPSDGDIAKVVQLTAFRDDSTEADDAISPSDRPI